MVFTAVDAKYERNPGMIGSMQGLKNEPRPARNAISILNNVKDWIFPPALVPKFNEVNICVRA